MKLLMTKNQIKLFDPIVGIQEKNATREQKITYIPALDDLTGIDGEIKTVLSMRLRN